TSVDDKKIVNNYMQESQKAPLPNELVNETNTTDSNKKLNKITLKDYDSLELGEIIDYDHRSSLKYIKDDIIINHSLVSVLFKTSILDPVYIRSTRLVFQISMNFAFNAILFTDNYIDARVNNKAGNVLIYTLLNEAAKLLFALIITSILNYLA